MFVGENDYPPKDGEGNRAPKEERKEGGKETWGEREGELSTYGDSKAQAAYLCFQVGLRYTVEHHFLYGT